METMDQTSGSPEETEPIKARIPQHVVYRSLVSETVMLNIQTGKYYGLNGTAGRMIEYLDRGTDFNLAVVELAAEFDAPQDVVREDFLTLCADLAQKGLIELETADQGWDDSRLT